MSKGSNRRRTQIESEEANLRWDLAFAKNEGERILASEALEVFMKERINTKNNADVM